MRGCEIEGMLDSFGRVIEEGPDPKPKITGSQRTFRVWSVVVVFKTGKLWTTESVEIGHSFSRIPISTAFPTWMSASFPSNLIDNELP